MIFARVFLILLVPLLVHGAPMGGGGGFDANLLNPTPNDELPKQAKIWASHSNSPPHPVHRSELGLHVSSRSDISKATCELQTGCMFFALRAPRSIRKKTESFHTSTDGIAITRFGVMIYIPERTTVIISDSDQSFVPPSTSGTDIKIMDKNDPLLRVVCVFQEGAKFITKRNPHEFRDLSHTVDTTSERIILTLDGRYFFLPKSTTVILLPDNVTHLPPSPTSIKEIRKRDLTRINGHCRKTYDECTPEDGEEKDSWEVYYGLCLNRNLWYASEAELVVVPVGVHK